MYFIYTFFLTLGLALAAPWYLLRFRRYGQSFRDRLGRLKLPQLRKSIWVHAVSVGEVKAVQQLLEKLRAAYPDQALVLSTVTLSGQQLARERKDVLDHVFYFPFDFPWAVRRTLDRVNPDVVIVAETEIWPNFLRACRERGIRVLMVNGRISDRSLPRYRLIRSWLKRVLDDYTVLGMQSEIDRGRIEMLGGNPDKAIVFGNLKYDALATVRPLEPALASVLKNRQPLWIAASTTPGEEELILDAFAGLQTRHPDLNLLIAPRRPERFGEVEKLIGERGFTCVRRTSLQEERAVIDRAYSSEVMLLDSIGELAGAFEFSTVVFMGGTLVPRGGHNVLEPARFAKPIVFGPHMENFREISEIFLGANAAMQVHGPDELGPAVSRMLTDASLAARLGSNARRVVEQNTGATNRVMAYLQPVEARR